VQVGQRAESTGAQSTELMKVIAKSGLSCSHPAPLALRSEQIFLALSSQLCALSIFYLPRVLSRLQDIIPARHN
jgi:hypothetical protein